jgi:micrococcal nuclease
MRHRIAQPSAIDADTIWLNGQKIRLADIDPSKVSEPRCAPELVLAARAADRMLEPINEDPFDL